MKFEEIKKMFAQNISDLYEESEIRLMFQVFAEHILGWNIIQQRYSSDKEISEEHEINFGRIISELKIGKPYQQIVGETEFYGMKIFVDENVLIPRPETEELLEITLQKIQSSGLKIQDMKILDIGTGSGIIPLVLKKHFPEAVVYTVDFSEKALKTARKNAEFHQTDIHFIHADYLKYDLNQNFDVIISNPPYIGMDEKTEIADSVKDFEPAMALFSPTSDALIFYRKIAEDAKNYLKKNGFIFLEINQKLGNETLALYEKDFTEAKLIKDLSGNDRFIVVKK
ncbi:MULTISPECIES: peptide chain release factor N(5)-glutamine methyltransferase [Chryseobacterium]|uniref:peptide chain release factor N(5)-glutamine methyltransferase n=1 Tax=Chryseobacterium taihuense TaxID=1141221 RepID=A0A4U8WDF2_9FLAO|nr:MULTISPECIES: peptide chain release factor N(5)-glutamine methyltransferase [Chryseobacterium]QQV03743.1 peptide chain release factor N(5)-glutamine methyltransferase [Chryseobacterium sp. FDAARGOS 1104]VFB02915.1 Release factor glutamine methyltransferase [Chryseobacterium taihuense]